MQAQCMHKQTQACRVTQPQAYTTVRHQLSLVIKTLRHQWPVISHLGISNIASQLLSITTVSAPLRYMLRISRLQLCPFLADRAMRAARLPSSWPNAFSRRIAPLSCRRLHGSLTPSKDSNIFPNDLQKTLDAHRSSNRASVVRKVYPKVSEDHAPIESGNDNASSGPAGEPPAAEEPLPATPGALNVRVHRSRPIKRARQPQTSLLQQNQVNTEDDQNPEQTPWLEHMDMETKPPDAMAHLDAEIRALERYMLPTPREHTNVDRLVSSITSHLAGIVPHPPLVIGSRRSGFAASHSNLDLLLPVDDVERSVDSPRNPRPTRPKMRTIHQDLLRCVANSLEQNPTFSRVHMPKRIPVVTAIHSPTDLRLQFSCGEGLPSSIEYISSYSAEYPALRPLYLATSVILEAQNMLGAHRSSIRSSALLMLLVAFLKLNHGRFHRPHTLGEQLLAVLHTYGTAIDLKSTGVSVDPPGFFNEDTLDEAEAETESPSLYTPQSQPHLRGQTSLLNHKRTAAKRRNFPTARRLCIQDPSNYMIDLGRSCTRTAELQDVFADAYTRLKDGIAGWDSADAAEADNVSGKSILGLGLRARFEEFEARRVRVAFGDGF